MADVIESEWVYTKATTGEEPLEDEPRNFRHVPTPNIGDAVTVAWDKSEEGLETSYDIEIDLGGAWTPVGSVAAGAPKLEITATNLTPKTEYNLRCKAKKG